MSSDARDSVVVVPPDASWASAFEQVEADLLRELGDRVMGIEHIGSTAVPGLAAKPVIDVLVGVRSINDVAGCVPVLEANGWEFSADFNRNLVGRRFFLRRNAHGARTHHAHFVVFGGQLWREYVSFRDALRASEVLRERYEALKRNLAARYHDQRELYTSSKTEFVKEVLGLAADQQPKSRG